MLTNYSQDHSKITLKSDIDFFNLEEKYFSLKKENEKFFFPWALENSDSYTRNTMEEIKKLESEESELKSRIEKIHRELNTLKNSITDF